MATAGVRMGGQSPGRKQPLAKPRKELDLSTYSNRIAARVLELRTKQGWTREQFWEALKANGLTVSVPTIIAWENGNRDISTDDIPVIAKTFGKSIRSFLPAE